MRSILQTISDAWRRPLAYVVSVLAAAGCSPAGPGPNPFRDDSIPRSEWTTPSAEAVAAQNVTAGVRERPWPPAEASYEPLGVPHWPLWWEDPFEDKGNSAKDRFAWTWEDYVALPYSNGRWLLNTVGWPISAIVTPPGTWWEDPFEDKGNSAKDRFAWTWEDIVALPYSNGRWLLNTVGWPISAIVTPPGTTMISDGYLSKQALGYDHDATRGKPWPVTADPIEAAPTTQPGQ